jgi:hypothetical protein
VIGYGAGGLCDSVRCLEAGASHPTGLLFPEQNAASLAAALEQFEAQRLWRQLPSEGQRLWAESFAPERFEQRLLPLLEKLWKRHRRQLKRCRSPLPHPVPLR